MFFSTYFQKMRVSETEPKLAGRLGIHHFGPPNFDKLLFKWLSVSLFAKKCVIDQNREQINLSIVQTN